MIPISLTEMWGNGGHHFQIDHNIHFGLVIVYFPSHINVTYFRLIIAWWIPPLYRSWEIICYFPRPITFTSQYRSYGRVRVRVGLGWFIIVIYRRPSTLSMYVRVYIRIGECFGLRLVLWLCSHLGGALVAVFASKESLFHSSDGFTSSSPCGNGRRSRPLDRLLE